MRGRREKVGGQTLAVAWAAATEIYFVFASGAEAKDRKPSPAGKGGRLVYPRARAGGR